MQKQNTKKCLQLKLLLNQTATYQTWKVQYNFKNSKNQGREKSVNAHYCSGAAEQMGRKCLRSLQQTQTHLSLRS